MPKYCSECGFKFRENAKFCEGCGLKIVSPQELFDEKRVELKEELKEQIESEFRGELYEEVRGQVESELREEITKEIRDETKKKMKKDIGLEIIEEDRKGVTSKELPRIPLFRDDLSIVLVVVGIISILYTTFSYIIYYFFYDISKFSLFHIGTILAESVVGILLIAAAISKIRYQNNDYRYIATIACLAGIVASTTSFILSFSYAGIILPIVFIFTLIVTWVFD